MAVEIVANTPLAAALQTSVQAKLVELGWSTDGADDNALAEYVVLMLVNGKTAQQVGTELSSDLGMDVNTATDFGLWLSDQMQRLGGQSGNGMTATGDPSHVQSSGTEATDGQQAVQTQDSEMEEAVDSHSEPQGDGPIPTGPRSMRDLPRSNTPRGRDKRLLGQMNKALDRTGDAPVLHRIKGAANAGRINTHSREPPRGPRNQMNNRGPQAQRLANAATQAVQTQMHQSGMAGAITPQQQMQLLAMYEHQAQMMAAIFNGQVPVAQNGFGAQTQSGGKSLFDRVDKSGGRQDGYQRDQTQQDGAVDTPANDISSSMEIDSVRPDPAITMCRFNLACTNPTCYFVHQSPAAAPGTTVDMADTCSFGAACKNRKCVGKHPSPSKLGPLRSEQECKFYPNCTNPNCPFKHPSMPACRNGADCATPGCKFSHTKTECKYNPCLNPMCPFKHKEGQKRGTFEDKVWTSNEDGDVGMKEHLSERKFATEGDEDLVIPGHSDDGTTPSPGALVT